MASLAQSIKFSIQKSPKISSTFAGRSNLAGNLVAVLRSNKLVVSLASKFEILPEKRLSPAPVGLSGKGFKFSGWDQLLRQRVLLEFRSLEPLQMIRKLKLLVRALVRDIQL